MAADKVLSEMERDPTPRMVSGEAWRRMSLLTEAMPLFIPRASRKCVCVGSDTL